MTGAKSKLVELMPGLYIYEGLTKGNWLARIRAGLWVWQIKRDVRKEMRRK